MSEIKANKISPAIGTDVTMGDSGDTFTIPAGATIVNSGTATGFGGITKSASDPLVTSNPAGGVGTVWLNTTTGEMYSLTDATAGANVWVNTGDGTGNVFPNAYMTANNTNGTEITDPSDANYKVVTFNTSGTFTPTIGTSASLGDKIEYLVIAGGGGGGGYGGGGGAGGYRIATNFSVTNTAIVVTVGAGGVGAPAGDVDGSVGTNSIFSSITSAGGGFGAGYSTASGGAGGSGGGGGGDAVHPGGAGNTPSTSPSQGNNGGASLANPARVSGGGGGSSAVGIAGGAGGSGTASSITGSAVTRAGGGGAGGISGVGAGGSGGGGAGSQGDPAPAATPATVNTGSGGGGGGGGGSTSGGAGGSGVVIIRYQFQ